MEDSPFCFENISVQDRFQAVTDLPHPQRLRFILVCGQVHPQPRISGVGHRMIRPEVQDAQSFCDCLRVTLQPAPAEQLVSDTGLLAHKSDLRGERVRVKVRQLRDERRSPGLPELPGNLLQEAHHIVKQERVVNFKQAVLQPGVYLAPGSPHHGTEVPVASEGDGCRIILAETLPHGMDPGNVRQRLRRPDRPDSAGRLLAVDRRIDIVDRYAVAGGIRQRRCHHMAVICIGQCFGPGLADAEGADRHARVHICVVLRRCTVQRREGCVCSPARHGNGFPAFLVPHGEHGQSGIGFLAPVVLQVHILPEGKIRGVLIVAVPLPRAEVFKIPQFTGNRLVKGYLGLEAKVVTAAFPYLRVTDHLQGIVLYGINVPDENLRSVSRHEQCFAGRRTFLFLRMFIRHIPEFIDRGIGFDGHIDGTGIEIQCPASFFHDDPAMVKAHAVVAETDRHDPHILS